MEIWKIIENSKGYAISNLGRVKRLECKKWCKINNNYSTYKEKLLTPSNKNTKKYWRIRIYYNDGSTVVESVHRLVAKAFIPNPENLEQVNHIDGNKDNNRVENLEWVTNKYNIQHSIKIGLRDEMRENAFGEGSNLNKYPEELIKKIPKAIIKTGSYSKAAQLLGISKTLITEIKAGRAWPKLNLHIPDTIYCKRYSPNLEEIQAEANNHATEPKA